MNTSDTQKQDSLKRRWLERRFLAIHNNHSRSNNPTSCLYSRLVGGASPPAPPPPYMVSPNNLRPPTPFLGGFEDDPLLSKVVPPVTVVFEGRSICHRISLDQHSSYQSLARALRQMFVNVIGSGDAVVSDNDLDLSNAVPGHLIAYEDMENDLLLVGDLNWKDFVRVAKRIRILPGKANSRKRRAGT